jgi:G3E family GTPase
MIPTNIITGFLGVGKTTAILDLLKQRPASQRWAVLVNEFGDVAIDQIPFLERRDDNLLVREVAGGCICCTAGASMRDALRRILQSGDINRLIIEPTGLGHPWRVLDSLRGDDFRDQLDLRATICLVDPRSWQKAVAQENRTFYDQAHLADVVAVNKVDLADKSLVAACVDWAQTLFPKKTLVATTQNGRLKPEWLDAASDGSRTPFFAEQHSHHHGKCHAHASQDLPNALLRGSPHRSVNVANGHHACGWVFSPDDVFDEDRLLETLFDSFDVLRLKGAFRIGEDWILVNCVDGEAKLEPCAYRRDSRMEAIAAVECDWLEYEKKLISCLK